MTRGNAAALGLENEIGTIAPGAFADLVVLDARATPAMAHRMEVARDLEEELFVLMTLGDDRAVRQTYIAGEPVRGDKTMMPRATTITIGVSTAGGPAWVGAPAPLPSNEGRMTKARTGNYPVSAARYLADAAYARSILGPTLAGSR